MDNDFRCGTCRYYHQHTGIHPYNYGECRWAERRALPFCMADRDWPVDSEDGALCQLWLTKAKADQEDADTK